MTPAVEAFFKRHENELDKTPYSTFAKECPRVKVSDATYYAWRRKKLNLPPYGTKPIRKTTRQRLYKQFFTVAKKDTTDEAVSLLRLFIEKMNSSNHNSRFELIEYVIKNENEDTPMIEVREYK